MLKYHPYLLLGGKYLECRQTDRCQTDRSLEWRKTDRCPGVEAGKQMPWSGGRQTDALEWRQTDGCPLQQNHKPYDVQLGASHNLLPFFTSLGTYVLLEP